MRAVAAKATVLIACALLCRTAPVACLAQAPAPPATSPGQGGAPRPGGASSSELPSAVSSDIERFMKRTGRALPAPAPPATRPKPAADFAATDPSTLPSIPPITVPPIDTGTAAPESPTRSPLAESPTLRAAPYNGGDLRFPINLATALRLSDARPLIVAAAQSRVWIAEAELTQAKLLLLPDFILNFDYTRHDGGGPDFNKGIMTAPSVNYFYGGTGLNIFVATTDVLFAPLAARQVLNSRHWDIQTAKNDALLETADAYFRVHEWRGRYAGTLYVVERANDVMRRVQGLSPDLVQKFEIDRARNMLADLEQRAVSARQQWRVQSARLTRVLRLDPRAVVDPLEHDHVQVTLIDPGRELDDLMPAALANRPEIASKRALVAAAEIGVRQEKARPFLPSVILNGFNNPAGMLTQFGIFGLGPNSSMSQWRERDDVSIQLIWQLQNLGFGNLARIKDQRGRESRAVIDLRDSQDRVAEEVNQALARLQSAAARVYQAERALRTGIITLNGSVEGLSQTSRFGDVLELISRPQEAIYALQLLNTAFDEYFATVADYNRAQFELFHAMGYPAAEVAALRPTGETMPVDTSRPSYLPAVGHGPPPATR